MMHLGNYGWGMGFGWISMVMFWALVVLGIVSIVQAISRRTGQSGPEETSNDILKRKQ